MRRSIHGKATTPRPPATCCPPTKQNTGCFCTCLPSAKPACVGKTDPSRNSTWNVAGYCGPNNTQSGRVAYYTGNFCAPFLYDDLDHRLGGDGDNPPAIGSASESAHPNDPSFFGMYVHDEPRMEFLPKVQSLAQYIRTYSRSTEIFGTFAAGWLQTPNQLSMWRDVDDLPLIDNYPIAVNFPIGGASPTAFPTLTPGPTVFPASEGVQQSVWKLLLSVNGDPTTSPITPGTRPIGFVAAGLGRGDARKMADAGAGAEHGMALYFRRHQRADVLDRRCPRRN